MRALMVFAVCALGAGIARADEARFMVYGGIGSAGFATANAPLLPGGASAKRAPPESANTNNVHSVMLAVGAVGKSRRGASGGGEIFTTTASAYGGKGGYSGVVTYAGIDSGRLILQGGIGVGAFWKLGENAQANFAGNVHTRFGLRLATDWVVLARGDALVSSSLGFGHVVTFGLQWSTRR